MSMGCGRAASLLRLSLAFLCLLLVAGEDSPAVASTSADWWGVVTYVDDGDTVRVQADNGYRPITVRLLGIDAPEICQSGGLAARAALEKKVLGQRVQVRSVAHDRYGRMVGRIERAGSDQGQYLVAAGLAWSYHYRVRQGPYAADQARAERRQKGVFATSSDPSQVQSPSDFRRSHGGCRQSKPTDR